MPKVFISWSGEAGRIVATALNKWLPAMLQNVKPFISTDDLRKGGRWNVDLASELEAVNFGVICLTPDNLNAPWILFEAGAISKVVSEISVAPVLFWIKPSEIPPPLTHFNATRFEKDEFRKLLSSINISKPEECVPDQMWELSFEACWPQFEAEVAAAEKSIKLNSAQKENKVSASQDKILEEILVHTRTQSQLLSSPMNFFPKEIFFSLLEEIRSRDSSINPEVILDLERYYERLRIQIDEMKDVDFKGELVNSMELLGRPVKYILRNGISSVRQPRFKFDRPGS